MRRARTADRLQDGIIVALVVSALALAATASRAERDGAWGNVTVVQAPTACANVRRNVSERLSRGSGGVSGPPLTAIARSRHEGG